MKNKSGFTLVEALITIVIVAVLASITVVAYTKVQQASRDSVRKGNATVVAEALEKYYAKNGEYPSVRSLVNNYGDNTGALVASKLGIDPNALKMPKMPSGTTNSLVSAATPTSDYIAYTAQSDINNNSCQTLLTGGCDQFTMKYTEESGTTITIDSRHKGRPSSLPTSPNAPNKPVLAANLSGTDVVATATADACETASLTQKFSFRSRINGGAWTAYTSWGTAATYSVPGSSGNTYDFQAVTRCDNGTAAGQSSPESDIATFQYPLGAPANPITTVTLSGSNALATITAVSCPSGSTAQYTLRNRVNDGTWSSYTAWSTSLTGSQAAAQGSKYEYQAKARCQQGSVTSPEATGSAASYVRPITAPATPTASNSTSGTTTSWTVSGTCPAGTTKEYQQQDSADWGYNSGWYLQPDPSYTGDSWYTASGEGYQFTEAFQLRCKTSYYTSGWSATASSSYIRPITPPGAPTNFIGSLASDRKSMHWNWSEPSCANSGLQGWQTDSARWPPNPYGGWTTPGWYSASWTQVTVDGSGQPIVISPGSQFQMKSQYECVNTTTGRTSTWGPIGESPIYTAP